MLRQDYERFLQIAPCEVSEKYYVQAELTQHWPLPASKLRKNNTTCLEKYHPKDDQIHQGIYIDIFPCDNLSDNYFISKLQFICARIVLAKTLSARGYETDSKIKKIFILLCRFVPLAVFHEIAIGSNKGNSKRVHTFFGGSCKFKKGIYPREWITESEDVQFEHLVVPVSSHYDELLTKMYGDYMTQPSEEERKCKVHAILVDTEKPYTEYEGYRDGMHFDVYTRSIR